MNCFIAMHMHAIIQIPTFAVTQLTLILKLPKNAYEWHLKNAYIYE